MRQRIWEIDYFRGIAIALMVIFHLVVDLNDFYGFPLNYLSGFWYYEGKISAILFMFLAGISSSLNQRTKSHGLKVLAASVLVSAITYLFNREMYVRFGILHFLGTAILLSPILKRLSTLWSLALAGLLILAIPWVDRLTEDSGLLLPIGVTPASFASMDYYPLIPWLSVFLLGLLAGRQLYAERRSRISPYQNRLLCKAGRHSLVIYLVHQPVLLAMLYLLLA